MAVKEIEARDWTHLKELMSDNYSHQYQYVFRGQRDSSWQLESTLSRLVRSAKSTAHPTSIEIRQILQFRMAIRGLRGPNPAKLNDDEVFCLGQHYGLATPLLDWTHSPYIAAYFAFESAVSSGTGKRTVWMLNRIKIEMEPSKHVKFLDPLQDDNNRIVAQAGLFTRTQTGTDLDLALERSGHLDCLTKFVIKEDERLDVLNDLRLMNIGASTLFPDLQGAAAYCNMWFETVHENLDREKEVQRLLEIMQPESDSAD
ncbi:MAG: FRG domain-containing protein [Oceanococcus sp.]